MVAARVAQWPDNGPRAELAVHRFRRAAAHLGQVPPGLEQPRTFAWTIRSPYRAARLLFVPLVCARTCVKLLTRFPERNTPHARLCTFDLEKRHEKRRRSPSTLRGGVRTSGESEGRPPHGRGPCVNRPYRELYGLTINRVSHNRTVARPAHNTVCATGRRRRHSDFSLSAYSQ